MPCPKCSGYMRKQNYVRKKEKKKGAEEVYKCRSCGHRLCGFEYFG